MKPSNSASSFTVAPHPAAAGVALVIAAHGSTRRPDANAQIDIYAQSIRDRRIFQSVTSVFLTAPIASANLAAIKAAPTVLVVPFMMADGYLADEAVAIVRAHIEASRQRFIAAAPVGTLEHIGVIADERAQAALLAHGYAPHKSELLLVAHGAKKRSESKDAAERHRLRLLASGHFSDVRLALLEEPPLLADSLEQTGDPCAVVGLFAAPGGHAVDDIRDAVQTCGRADVINAGAVGLDPRMADLAVIRAMQALSH